MVLLMWVVVLIHGAAIQTSFFFANQLHDLDVCHRMHVIERASFLLGWDMTLPARL
jgi:hypothetical protein